MSSGDEFLDEFLGNDASLDDGSMPDIKVMDSGINMTGNEVRIVKKTINCAGPGIPQEEIKREQFGK
jgi:hypothetical protein